ncbi:hypothetical protein D9M73_189730 [compost metagenome]
MGHGKRRPRTFTAIRQHVRRGFAQRDQQQHDHHQHRPQRRNPEAKQSADACRADNPAQAEQAMEPRHHVFAAGALDDHRLQVDRRIHGAEPRAEHEQCGDQRRNRRHCRQQRQGGTDQQGPTGRHPPAAETRGQDPGHRHRQDRTYPQTQQQQTQGAFIQPGPRLGIGHQRRPRGDTEPGDEKGDARGHLFLASWHE